MYIRCTRFCVSLVLLTAVLGGASLPAVGQPAPVGPRAAFLYSEKATHYLGEWDKALERAGFTHERCPTPQCEQKILPALDEYDIIITSTVWNLYDKVDFTQMGPRIADWVRAGGVLILGDQNYGPQLDFLKSFPEGFYHFVRPGFYWENGKRPGDMALPPPSWVADIGLMRAPCDLRAYLPEVAKPCWQSLGEMSAEWQPLVRYENGHTLMAMRPLGDGLVISMSYYMTQRFVDFQEALLRNLWCHMQLARAGLELRQVTVGRDAIACSVADTAQRAREVTLGVGIARDGGAELAARADIGLQPGGAAEGTVAADLSQPGVYELRLSLSEGDTTLWTTEKLRHEVFPPIRITVNKSYFYTGPVITTIRFRTPTGLLPAEAPASATLTGPDGQRVPCTLEPSPREGCRVLKAGALPPGAYTLKLTAQPAGGEEGSADAILTVLGRRRVMFDENNVCLVDGEPFFPLGIYFPPPSRFGAMREQGFNFMYWLLPRGWGATGEALGSDPAEEMRLCIERAEQVGLMNLPHVTPSRFAEWIPLLRESPSTLAYYIYDEPDESKPGAAAMAEWYQAMRALDPEHPVFLLQNRPDVFDIYAPYCDIHASDPYPLGRRPLRMVADYTDLTIAAVHGEKPVWMTMWAYGGYQGGPRLPTPAELNSCAWLTIAHGARGIFWYCYYTGKIGHDQTLEDFPELWGAFKPLLSDLKQAEPLVLAPDVEPTLTCRTDDPARAAALSTLERQVGEKRWLLLVNDEEAPMAITVDLAGAAGARDVLRGEALRAADGMLKLTLDGYGAMVVEVG